MAGSVMWKACQRRLYSWLSSRCGLPVCVVGIFIAFISALQFGEVLLEWSKEKYTVQFSVYADNIAARSYERELCPPLPIDVVYTWVNGSDPILIKELQELKKRLARKATSPPNATNSSANATPTDSSPCPFHHCVPWRTLIIDASNQTTPLTLETLKVEFPSLAKALNCTLVKGTGTHTSPVYVVRLASEEQVSSILKVGLVDRHGHHVNVTRGYLTSDGEVVGVVKMESFYVAVSDGIRPLNSSKLFRKWLESHYGKAIAEAEVKANRTAVVSCRTGEEGVVTAPRVIPHLFSGENVSLHQGYLIWLPFSIPTPEHLMELERPDIVSASRFQDNEELRYSLRSVERFAPWVRHIFVVTNGQIPSWLNLDSPRLTLVTHKDIFPNHTHLPTYSSPAIESHLHRIPGLADHFIYLNDDVMFGDYVWPEDFYTYQKGQKVYLSWPVPNCAEGCPPSWIRDKYCDANCNNSACDWDGGDCANASRPGPVGAQAGYQHTASSSDYCGPGCLDSWLGDRYCDSACRTPDCGYDAGDCGTAKWEELLAYNLTRSGGQFRVPLETAALYFNLSEVFVNGSVLSASHTPSKLVRTAIVAQKYKTLALTLARNISLTSLNFSLAGSSHGKSLTVNFSLTGDTATKNKSKIVRPDENLLSVDINDTSSRQFLQAVIDKLKPTNHSINYWIQTRTASELSAPPPTVVESYIVPNTSLLPHNVSHALQQLETDLSHGELTQLGYAKRHAALLRDHLHLVTFNGSLHFRRSQEPQPQQHGGGGRGERKEEEGRRAHVELNRLQDRLLSRKLLQHSQEEGVVIGWEESYRRLPWEKLHLFDTPPGSQEGEGYSDASVTGFRSRRLLEEMTDTFADSLRHVNRLFTKTYGHDTRKVPSHMPHYIQKDVMIRLQDKFPQQYEITSSHPVRSADDMQFAFSYFYFLMSEKMKFDVDEIYKDLDTDGTGILSVRELRTMLTLISSLPITMEDVSKLENILKTCDEEYTWPRPQVSELEYETLYDPKLPLLTLNFTQHCQPLLDKLKNTVTDRHRYKFEEVTEDVIGFKMVNENSTEVIMMLDELRKQKKKFICLNDNIDHTKPGADLAKLILVDFYESLFPHPSQFEIPGNYRNRFLHLDQLREWLVFKDRMHLLLYVIFSVTLLLSAVSLFYGKLIKWKRKFTRTLTSIFVSRRTPSI